MNYSCPTVSVPQKLVQRGELFGRESDFRRDALDAGKIVVEGHDRPCALVDRDPCVVPIPAVDVRLACQGESLPNDVLG